MIGLKIFRTLGEIRNWLEQHRSSGSEVLWHGLNDHELEGSGIPIPRTIDDMCKGAHVVPVGPLGLTFSFHSPFSRETNSVAFQTHVQAVRSSLIQLESNYVTWLDRQPIGGHLEFQYVICVSHRYQFVDTLVFTWAGLTHGQWCALDTWTLAEGIWDVGESYTMSLEADLRRAGLTLSWLNPRCAVTHKLVKSDQARQGSIH